MTYDEYRKYKAMDEMREKQLQVNLTKVSEDGSSADDRANTKAHSELAKEEPIDSLDSLLENYRNASFAPMPFIKDKDKWAEQHEINHQIQLAETVQAIKDLFSRESSKREADIRIDQTKLLQEGEERFGKVDWKQALYELSDRVKISGELESGTADGGDDE